jgi:hypothetical protein
VKVERRPVLAKREWGYTPFKNYQSFFPILNIITNIKYFLKK